MPALAYRHHIDLIIGAYEGNKQGGSCSCAQPGWVNGNGIVDDYREREILSPVVRKCIHKPVGTVSSHPGNEQPAAYISDGRRQVGRLVGDNDLALPGPGGGMLVGIEDQVDQRVVGSFPGHTDGSIVVGDRRSRVGRLARNDLRSQVCIWHTIDFLRLKYNETVFICFYSITSFSLCIVPPPASFST